MAKTTTKKQALRAFRDALLTWVIRAGSEPSAREVELAFARALQKTLECAPVVSIPGLGTFRRTTRAERNMRRPPGVPNAGTMFRLPETHSVRFSPCGEWRRSLK